MEFTTLGALVGLIIAIILIIKKVHPAYSLILVFRNVCVNFLIQCLIHVL